MQPSIKFVTVNLVCLAAMVISFPSCTPYPDGVSDALQMAGRNKGELQKVLNHYSCNPEDSLKYRATEFLIMNMPWHTSTQVEVPESAWEFFYLEDSLIKNRMRNGAYWKYQDALNGYKYLAKKIFFRKLENQIVIKNNIPDILSIDAAFLIENIEYAFKVKGLDWNKSLGFEKFCEYILPYRISAEPVFNIRGKLYRNFLDFVRPDTCATNPTEAVSLVNKYITNFYWDWDEIGEETKDYGFFNIFNWNNSNLRCVEQVPIQGQILRSVGIPAVEVFVPAFRDTDIGHSSLAYYDSDGNYVVFVAIYQDPPDTIVDLWELNRGTKYYERTFAPQKNTPWFLKSETEKLPASFASPLIRDITSALVATRNFDLELKEIYEANNLCYFCTFVNSHWVPVGWGEVNEKNKTAHFKNMPLDLTGMPCFYTGNRMVPAGKMVKIAGDSLQPAVPSEDTGMLTLTRKFPHKDAMKYFTRMILGTTIEGANNKDFSDAKILSILDDTLKPYFQDHVFNNTKPYRYYRIVSPGYHLYVAEVEFLINSELPGTSPASPLPVFDLKNVKQKKYFKDTSHYIGDDVYEMDYKAFDSDMLTYTEKKWVGVDLGVPRVINRIRIAPRNADNGIIPGDNYQLLYWDDGWETVGATKAIYNFVPFDSVPLNTLYWLRNTGRGKEELPFYYEGGNQVFTNFVE